jgi:hypothetical protein
MENSFVITFLFVLLIFSNTWSYLNELMLFYINKSFPCIQFNRSDKDRVHWIMQAIIGGAAFALTLWAVAKIFSYFVEMLSNFIT